MKRFFTLTDESYEQENEPSLDEEEESPQKKGGRHKATLISLPSPKKQEIVVLEPLSLDEARQVADQLKSRKSIIVNVKKADKDIARRIVDFLSGICYALDGHVQLIAESIFVFVPSNVGIVLGGRKNNSRLEEYEEQS
jgi:cell division inhibitor SepF